MSLVSEKRTGIDCQDFSVPGVLESPLGEAGKKRIKKALRNPMHMCGSLSLNHRLTELLDFSLCLDGFSDVC